MAMASTRREDDDPGPTLARQIWREAGRSRIERARDVFRAQAAPMLVDLAQ
jgi:hypothetical protein